MQIKPLIIEKRFGAKKIKRSLKETSKRNIRSKKITSKLVYNVQ